MKRTALYNMVHQQIRRGTCTIANYYAYCAACREDFLPTELRPFAYMDIELPLVLNDGDNTGTKLMPPRLLARMVQELDLQGTENVALVGGRRLFGGFAG